MLIHINISLLNIILAVQVWFFLGLIFTTAQEVSITAKIAFISTSLTAVHIYDFYIFTVI